MRYWVGEPIGACYWLVVCGRVDRLFWGALGSCVYAVAADVPYRPANRVLTMCSCGALGVSGFRKMRLTLVIVIHLPVLVGDSTHVGDDGRYSPDSGVQSGWPDKTYERRWRAVQVGITSLARTSDQSAWAESWVPGRRCWTCRGLGTAARTFRDRIVGRERRQDDDDNLGVVCCGIWMPIGMLYLGQWGRWTNGLLLPVLSFWRWPKILSVNEQGSTTNNDYTPIRYINTEPKAWWQ